MTNVSSLFTVSRSAWPYACS